MTTLQQIPEIFAEADKPYKPLNNLNFKPIQPNYNPIINSGLLYQPGVYLVISD